jgi:4-amino-4-deoxy-L-arabinose transferase-like glycosyltransferase
MISYLRNASPTRLAIFLLLAVTLFRLWFSTQIGLIADEAYYWLWSKHLAASYRDKGPAIAWTIALGTKCFGDTVFGIRFFAVLLGAGIGWLIFDIARRLYDARTGLWCLIVALVMPIMAVGSILMTIDSLSVFFWALAVLIFWKALHNDSSWYWFWLGLAIGAGFLAKFTNGVQAICVVLFLLWSKEHRPLLFSRKFIVMCFALALSSMPILWWNIQTGWVHVIALRSRSGAGESFGIHPGELLFFLGEQFVVMSPLFMAGILVAAVMLCLTRHKDLRMRFLMSQFAPIYGLFLFFSLNAAGKANWTVPALVTGIIFTVVFWREILARKPAWRWAVIPAFAIALLMTIVLHNTDWLKLPSKQDPLRRAQGWPDFAAHVQKARDTYKANLVIAQHYSTASLMTFYLPDQPTTYLLPREYGASQFTLWPGYEVTPETRALFVTGKTNVDAETFRGQFSKVEKVDDFWSMHRGRPMFHYCIYLCTP